MSETGEVAWQFWLDRGGTFTDCLGIDPQGVVHTAKVLSSDEAPIEAITAVLAAAGSDLDPARVEARVKLGTTLATNALLERRGVATALVTNEGLAGVFDIGTQQRPEIFALEIERPPRLQSWRLEVGGRRDAMGGIVEPLDLAGARRELERARVEGAQSVAIAWLHAHVDPADEVRLAALAREIGFEHVVASHETAREIGLLSRGETAIADAYLTPLLRGHVDALVRALPRSQLRFMQSSGGLTERERFRGPNALLSGPAGGVVATAWVARRAGHTRAIGFDMGGTSTDVSLVEADRLDRAFESEVGGVRVKAPMLRIHTVAAGGGSLCRFDGIRLTVGPESAGSMPGPLCYALGRAGASAGEETSPVDAVDADDTPTDASALTLTDVNLWLGRVLPDRFPFPLARAPVARALGALRDALAEAGFDRSPDELAAGFCEVANANMAQAIVEISVARGRDPRDCVLVGFGGAGGQHVCAIADRLGMAEILLHPHAGLLSALGIGIAPPIWDGERDGRGRALPSAGAVPASVVAEWQGLEREALSVLAAEQVEPDAIVLERNLDLVYAGTDTALTIAEPTTGPRAAHAPAAAWCDAFEAEHRARFGYVRRDRGIEIKALRLHARGPDGIEANSVEGRAAGGAATVESGSPAPSRFESAWFPGIGRVEAPVYFREALAPGTRLAGPALVLEKTGTVVLDPGFSLVVSTDGVFRLRAEGRSAAPRSDGLRAADPVRLEVLGNRFMSIAEQMGAVLRNTAVSTNIKERLDYSCAVFDQRGGLVANAPHIPVHLGAMAECVEVVRARFEPVARGDVYVTNDPFEGGSHLPDVTVVTPVFVAEQPRPSFYVASRGHHADLGGKTPGSMPADSSSLAQEGVLIEAFPLVRDGLFDEERIRRVLASGPHPARRPDDNVADLEAMVAANRAGARLLDALAFEVGEAIVQQTMVELQEAAARKVARELARLEPGLHRFADALDDGTPICVELAIEHAASGSSMPSEGAARGGATTPVGTADRDPSGLAARMRIDFSGTGPASAGNLNAPPAVVRSAVIYVLRALVDERIPLNGGCLTPVQIVIPEDSILSPPRGAAVVGGNVETSQRVVDVLLGALGRAAASQGTMNNVTFGDERFGYYETIGGGVGGSARAAGAAGVHSHMTNTRITDPEVLEARFPVRLLVFGLRAGSGGRGARPGGDGIVRAYRFLRPVTLSLLTERRVRRPFGLAGGEAGALGRNTLRRARSGARETLPGGAQCELEAGDELWIETPGGGGFGEP